MIFINKNLSLSVNLSSLLVCLIPLALLTGPFLPDLFLSLIVVFIFYEILIKKKFLYLKNIYFYLLALFYFYILFRSIFSDYPFFSLESSFFYFRFFLFSISVWYLLDHNKNLLKNFTIFFLLTFTIALIDGYFQYFNGVNIFGIVSQPERMNLLTSEKLILGGYLSRLFPLLIGLILINLNNNYINIILFCSLLILTDVLVFITGERTAVILLLISSLFILIFISKYKLLRLITIILSISVMIIITIFNEDVRRRNVDTTLNQVGISENSNQMYILSPAHQSHYTTAFKMFLDNPIFGQGPKTFRILCSKEEFNFDIYSCSTHPHNTYIQLLAETGIVGTIFPLIFFLYLIFKMIKHIHNYFFHKKLSLSDYQICLLACVLITLWPIAPTNNFFNNWINIVYYLPVGFYLHSIYLKEND